MKTNDHFLNIAYFYTEMKCKNRSSLSQPDPPLGLCWASFPSCATLFPPPARHFCPVGRLRSLLAWPPGTSSTLNTENQVCWMQARENKTTHGSCCIAHAETGPHSQLQCFILSNTKHLWWCGFSHSSKRWFYHLWAFVVVFCLFGWFGCGWVFFESLLLH